MKTNRFRSLLFLATVCSLVTAQTKLDAEEPIELKLFPANAKFAGLDERLFPLGWSKSGEHLAVLSAKPNEAADERTWEFRVMDLVADKSLHVETFRVEDGEGITPFWEANEPKISALLDTFGIQADLKSFQRHSFPALEGKYRGESYEVSMNREYGESPLFGYRGVQRLQLSLSNQNGKSKKILDLKYEKFYPIAAGTVGYLPNPQGDRIAVLVALTKRGYEGPPHVREFLIVGARIGEKF